MGMQEKTFRLSAVIPCFNHGSTLSAVLGALEALGIPALVVDDGSTEENKRLIASAVSSHGNASLLTLEKNGGKGAAVLAGLLRLASGGFTHALQLDADGQHNAEDIPKLVTEAEKHPDRVISGLPVYGGDVPKGRKYGRLVTDFWVALETLSFDIRDSMCGFRVYPLGKTVSVLRSSNIGLRMDFDIEIMVRLYWAGCRFSFIPTRVIYPEGGLSHFNALKDNVRISKMHAALFLQSPLHWKARAERFFGGSPRGEKTWDRVRERRGAPMIRLMLWFRRNLGETVFRLALYPVIGVFCLTASDARRESAAYIEKLKAFRASRGIPKNEREEPLTPFRHFMHFGQSMVDRLTAWSGAEDLSEKLRPDPGVREVLTNQNPGERGKMILVSHIGVADVLRAAAEFSGKAEITVLLHKKNAEGFQKIVKAVAPDADLHVLPVDSVGVETAVLLSEKIEAGGWVAMAADRTPVGMGDAEERTVRVPFLGEDAPFPSGPWILASLLGCEVRTLFSVRDGGGFRVMSEKIADRVRLPRKNRDEAVSQYARHFADAMERAVCAYPLEWFNFYDFWHRNGRKTID